MLISMLACGVLSPMAKTSVTPVWLLSIPSLKKMYKHNPAVISKMKNCFCSNCVKQSVSPSAIKRRPFCGREVSHWSKKTLLIRQCSCSSTLFMVSFEWPLTNSSEIIQELNVRRAIWEAVSLLGSNGPGAFVGLTTVCLKSSFLKRKCSTFTSLSWRGS